MQHPDPTELGNYLRGTLSWPEMESLEQHLDHCTPCRGHLESQESGSDSFLGCLQRLAKRPQADPALPRLLETAQFVAQSTVDHVTAPQTRRVAGCELLDEKGIPGGLGVVYKARHLMLKEVRAIKRPRTLDHVERAHLLARFRREVEAVGAIRHDNVVRAHDAGEDVEGPYLVMEFLDGATLNGLVKKNGPLPVPEACEMMRQAALGLQAAHERGMVHRDIKPGNLLLARAENGQTRLVVIDWGLVRWTQRGGKEEADDLTRSGVALGTPDFIAPEQAQDAEAVDIRADIYSLGVTLYYLLAGRSPFHDRPRVEKLLAHQRDPFPPLAQYRSDLPAALLAVLAKMVAKDPKERMAAPIEVATALEPFCVQPRLRALLDPEYVEAPRPIQPRRRRWGWMVGLAVGFLLGGLLLSGWFARRTRPVPPGSSDGSALGAGPAVPEMMRDQHPGLVTSLHFTPDGKRAICESGGGMICVWDLPNRHLEKSIPHLLENPQLDESGLVALSADGRLFVAAGVNFATHEMQLFSLFDQSTCTRVGKDDGFGKLGRAIALSPNGTMLAAVELPLEFAKRLLGAKPHLVIIDVATGQRKKSQVQAEIRCLAFSAGGEALATGSDDKIIRLWDPRKKWAPKGKEPPEHEFKGHTGAVEQVAFSADGKRLFSASGIDRTLRVWNNDRADPKRGKQVKEIALDTTVKKYPCIAFDGHGRAITGSDDGRVVLWGLDSGKELWRFTHKGVTITAVAISPDGHHALAAGADRQLWLCRLPPPNQ